MHTLLEALPKPVGSLLSPLYGVYALDLEASLSKGGGCLDLCVVKVIVLAVLVQFEKSRETLSN